MSRDITLLGFDSSLNYLKREPAFVGSEDLTLGGAGTTVQKVVTHDLGYVPFHQVGAELIVNDGTIWNGAIIDRYTETSLSGYSNDYPTLDYWCTTTALTISIYNNTSPAQSGTRKVYWAIYLDYTE